MQRVWMDLQDYWCKEDDVVKELAKKHKKTEQWMCGLVVESMASPEGSANTELGFMQKLSLLMKVCISLGEKACLKDLHQLENKVSGYKDIPETEMDEMVHCLEEKRLLERKGMRSRPAAHVRDVKKTASNVAQELNNLGSRCATASMAITVCTDPSHSNSPVSYHDEISRDFIELLFGMDFDKFALKFEAYALFRIKGVAKNSNKRKTMTKRIVCAMVRRGLHAITGNSGIDMEWKCYETKIVNLHQVELVGWLVNQFDPYILGINDLEMCIAALKGPDATCYWQKINEQELSKHQEQVVRKKALGEIVTKQRKKRADAGVKQGQWSKNRSKADSDKENKDRARKKSKKTQSSSIIDSDDESDLLYCSISTYSLRNVSDGTWPAK
ncbi:hypothetical protein K439DRAFT_1620391 [Ramaria rubella]|nr:hypothetical protein K439DRAFT_1620391 [Ramaria rubella]